MSDWDREEGEPFTVDKAAELVGKTAKGIWVKHALSDKDEFFPDSQIHGDSELHMESKIGEKGTLVITEWLAGERGYL